MELCNNTFLCVILAQNETTDTRDLPTRITHSKKEWINPRKLLLKFSYSFFSLYIYHILYLPKKERMDIRYLTNSDSFSLNIPITHQQSIFLFLSFL